MPHACTGQALQNIITRNITEASFIFTVRITLSEHQEPTLGPSHCVPAIVYRAARHWIPSPLHDKECLLSSNLTLCCTWWQQTLLPFSPPNNFQCFSNSLVAIFFKQFSCPSITLLEELKYKKKVTSVYNLFIYIENSCFAEMGLRSNFRSAYSNS